MTPREVVTKWLDDLRNGGHKQTQHRLLDGRTGGMCCIGVLGICTMGYPTGNTDETYATVLYPGAPSSETTMPSDLFESLTGLTYDDCGTFMGMNDQGISFPKIASKIETIATERGIL